MMTGLPDLRCPHTASTVSQIEFIPAAIAARRVSSALTRSGLHHTNPHRRQVTPRSSGPKLLIHHSRNVELPKQRLPLLPDIVELVERARSEARDDLNNALLGCATCDVTFAFGVTESGEGGRRNYRDNVAQPRERYQGSGHAAHQRWAVSSPVQESWSRSIRRAPS